ncbi:MAG TPA: Ger(x)C family spore germination protein [Clostridiaceae bacterium]|nr:Ger(x)C family spore germination protein [Clostridiaceae bacterium]
MAEERQSQKRDKRPGGESKVLMYGKIKKRSGIVRIAFLLMILLLLTGCWNNRDLTEINIVAGIGLDRTEDGKVLLTVQVVEPAAIQTVSSGKGKGGGAQPKPVFVESFEGETVFEAIRGILSIVDKRLFFSTAQVLILGERLLQKGMVEVLDFFQRENDINYGMNILVAKGVTPGEILEIENDMDSIPAVYIKETAENTVSRGTVKKTTLIDLIKDIDSGERQPAIGQITKAGDKEIRTEGVAVIKDEKLAGWLDPYETRGYMFAIGEVKSAIVNIPVDKGKIAMEIIRSKGKAKVRFENGEPSTLTIKVEVEANVGAYEGRGRLDSQDDLSILKEILKNEIKKEITQALEKAQKEYSSDIFGFGSYVHKYHPEYWKKVKKDWNDIFSKLPADIQVDVKVMRTGIIKSPVKKDE